jgi:hypothetical protein
MAGKARLTGKDRIPPPEKNKPRASQKKEKKYRFSDENEDLPLDKNTLIILGVVLAAVVILGAGIILMLNSPEEKEKPDIIIPDIQENTTNETVEECDDYCLLEKAVLDQNLSVCSDIENSTIEQLCYEGLANQSLDACRQVSNKSIKKGCIRLHASANGDTEICEYLEKGIMDCKAYVDDCYDIEDEDGRAFCLATSHGDIEYCGDNDECIYDFSLKFESDEGCELITDEVKRYACMAIILDQDECYHAPGPAKKDLCRLMWAKASGDRLICTMLRPDMMYALECYNYFAIEDNEPEFCKYNDALSLNNLWACYKNYSISTGDLKGCQLISKWASTSQFTCYFEVAKKYGNPEACDMIGNPARTVTCYVGSILDNPNLDYEHCGDVTRVVWKNKCYTEYAIMVNDSSYCDYIEQPNEEQLCYDSFEIAQSND